MSKRIPINHPILSNIYDSIPTNILSETKKMMELVNPIKCTIWGKEYESDKLKDHISPVNDKPCVQYHIADSKMVSNAVDTWEDSYKVKVANPSDILRKAGSLAAGKYFPRLMASTMLGQGKTYYQAEVDVAELVDFFNMNAYYTDEIINVQPLHPYQDSVETYKNWADGTVYETRLRVGYHNTMEYRPFKGITTSITPFNFTAIAGNLVSLPAVLGNPVIWKPSERSILSSSVVYELLLEAGLPKEKISFMPTTIENMQTVLTSPNLTSVVFTGSSNSFDQIRKTTNSVSGKHFPRLIGETGGKNYILIDDADSLNLAAKGAYLAGYEYSGQKCSACSVVYLPEELLTQFVDIFKNMSTETVIGNPLSIGTQCLTGPLIDIDAVAKYNHYLEVAKNDPGTQDIITFGSNQDVSELGSCYVKPVLVINNDLNSPLFREEIFAPFITLYPYNHNMTKEDLVSSIQSMHDYALTGSVYSKSKSNVNYYVEALADTAGNFYINNKCTGSVVGQQPFGGACRSGTNDKAGGPFFPLRFMNIRTIKNMITY